MHSLKACSLDLGGLVHLSDRYNGIEDAGRATLRAWFGDRVVADRPEETSL